MASLNFSSAGTGSATGSGANEISSFAEELLALSKWERFVSTLQIIDGNVALSLKVDNDCNFEKSSGSSGIVRVPLVDLRPFLAGLTVSPVSIDGGFAGEGSVKMLLLGSDELQEVYLDDHLTYLHQPYVLWTEDSAYTDPILTELQTRIAHAKTLAKDVKTSDRLAMVVDMYETLFTENLPSAFLEGLALFQEVARDCTTHLVLAEGSEEPIGSDHSASESDDD